MALGKTVAYTLFNETSFGYGNDEIASVFSTEFPLATSIVKVTIDYLNGNWFSQTGHLSTPSVGTAVAIYNNVKKQWSVKGERDDVDAVLAAMSFFPADKFQTREWEPTPLKTNVTTGNYGSTEEPPTVGDTTFTVRVYDGSTQVSSQTLTFDPSEAVFDNQRPYWAIAPTAQDLNTAEHDEQTGGLLDLGTISHGTDTENVQVKCEFRHYGFTNHTTTGSYGSITDDSNIFIGDKKPATSDSANARFDFTGSVAECNAYLDNVRYYGAGNETTFDMFLTVTDGVVGSTLTKTCYFSDALIGVSTLPDVHYVEDANPAFWDFGNLVFSYNDMREVNTFTATITLDATGRANCTSFDTYIGVDSQSYTSGTGVLLITETSLVQFKAALRNLRFTPVADYSGSFGMTVDFTFSNPIVGTSYSATQQSLNVTGQEIAEVTANINSTYEWTEDQRFDFTNMFQISHGYNHRFDVIFTLSDANAGSLFNHSNAAFFTSSFGTSAQYKIEGTRVEVNESLQNLFFTPSPDYDDNFTIGITVDRTTGDLTYETQSTGTFTMNATALPDFSFPLSNPEIRWENNVTKQFNSNLQITDTADEAQFTPQFGSTYTVIARLKIAGSTFTHGVLTLRDADVVTVTNDFTNAITLTGTKDAVNAVLKNLIFVPDPLYEELHDFYVEYQVTRDADNVVLEGTDFSPSIRTDFKNPTITAPYSINRQLFDWVEDTTLAFDSKFSITENITTNSYYTGANGYTSWYGSFYRVTLNGSQGATLPEIKFATTKPPHFGLQVSGIGTYADPLILEGYRDEINKALALMTITPTVPDFTTSALDSGGFWLEGEVKRLRDNSVTLNYNPSIADFNAGTDTSEYRTTWTDVKYIEDIKNQYLFAHIDDFIQDGSGDLFDTTYDVTIALANETTGKFVPYVEEGYLDEDVALFISDYAVRIVGSKDEVNASIHDIIFTPLPDVNTNVDIHYTQKRIYNNSTLTQADDVVVTTMIGIDVPDYRVATQYSNVQLFVQDEFLVGVDLTNSQDYDPDRNEEVDQDILDENAFVTLTPSQLRRNEQRSKVFPAPIEVLDRYEDGGPSLYKVEFDNGSLSAILGASLNITDTGWMTKSELNDLLKDGIYVTGVSIANNNVPEHAEKFEVSFEVKRKTATGTIAILPGPTNNLTYSFMSGITLYVNEAIQGGYNTIARLDNKTTDYDLYQQYKFGSFIGRQSLEFRRAGPLQSQYTLPDGNAYYKSRYYNSNRMALYGRIYDVSNEVWSTYKEDLTTYTSRYYSTTKGYITNTSEKLSVWHQLNIGSAIIKATLSENEQIYPGSRENLHPAFPDNDLIFTGEKVSDTNTRNQISLSVWTDWGAYLQVGSRTTDGDEAKIFINDTTYDESDF